MQEKIKKPTEFLCKKCLKAMREYDTLRMRRYKNKKAKKA